MSPFLIILAVLPGLLICWLVFLADRYEREPLVPLVLCFVAGAAATFPAMLFEQWAIPMVGEIGSDPILTFLLAFGPIAPVEEFMKWAVLLCFAFPWRFFNEPFDGIVYAVMIAMGFATVENLLYVNLFGHQTAILRAFTAVPAHLVFAIVQGYYAGLAKFAPAGQRVHWLWRGLIISLLLHGGYDFLILQNWTKWLASLGAICVYLCLYYFTAMFREHLENSPFRPNEQIPQSL